MHPRFPAFVIPADHSERPIGGSSVGTEDRDYYAHVVAAAQPDPHGRGDNRANARLIAAAPQLKDAVGSLLGWLLQASPEEFVDWLVDQKTPGFEMLSRDEWKAKLREAIGDAHAASAKAGFRP